MGSPYNLLEIRLLWGPFLLCSPPVAQLLCFLKVLTQTGSQGQTDPALPWLNGDNHVFIFQKG